jgi:hypothetical protein
MLMLFLKLINGRAVLKGIHGAKNPKYSLFISNASQIVRSLLYLPGAN